MNRYTDKSTDKNTNTKSDKSAPQDATLIAGGALVDVKKQVSRVLIIGVNSYLGTALASSLREEIDVIGTYHKNFERIDGVTAIPLDTLNNNTVFETLKRFQPDVCLYCPGVQNIDIAQTNRELADNLHGKAPALYFKIPVSNFHFVYFSTDQVFGTSTLLGQSPPFSEEHETSFINSYAQTKMQGEGLIRGQGRFTHILRLAEIFGEAFGTGDTHQRRCTWIEPYRRALERGEKFSVSTDEVRSFLYVGDYVRAVKAFLKGVGVESSLLHVGASNAMSRYDFVKLMAQKLGFDEDLVKPVSMDQDRSVRTPRPANCSLDSKKFSQDYGFNFQSIDQSLDEFAERLRTGFTKAWTF